jgi:hypothetical protein
MKILKWVFAVLYVLVIIGLFGFAYSCKVERLGIFYGLTGNLFWTIFILIISLISQGIFIFSTGKIDLERPKNRYFVLVPIAVAALSMAMLVYGIVVSTGEVIAGRADLGILGNFPALLVIVLTFWILWGIIFYRWMKEFSRYNLFKSLISTMITGSIIEFLPAVFMHLITGKRQECFAGMYTGIGVSFGLVVMLWSFGPGIIFLFIREKYRRERKILCNKREIAG